jgi:serine/threonine protein kinase
VLPAADHAAGARPDGPHLVGGYRLVRTLGEGRSAVVHLGYADTATDDEPRRTAAVKIYRPAVSPEHIDAEVAALAAVAHPHVLRLVDIATAPDGRPSLVLERCAAGTLAALVAKRSSLAAGEAVTILAPLVAAVAAVHAAGFVHRDIRLSSVLFLPSGAPVLAGFGHAARIPVALSPAGLAAHPAVRDDRSQLGRLAGAVLERVDHPAARGIDSWLESAPESTDDFTERLSDVLFDLADAQPVRMRDEAALPGALNQPRRPATVTTAQPAAPTGAARQRLEAAVRALLTHARGVRRPVWLSAAAVGVSLLVAALAIPPNDSVAEPGTAEARVASPSPSPPANTGRDRDVPGPAEGEAARGEAPSPDDVVLGDDPAAAIVVLLEKRGRCLREISVLCLDAVAQPGSAALLHDVEIVRGLQAGGEQTPDATIIAESPVLVERLGDSALLDLGEVPDTQPASALMMRGEAGWRIRDYLDE